MNKLIVFFLLFSSFMFSQNDYATINIYRPKKTQGSGAKFHVLINNVKTCILKSGGHLEYKVFTENTFNISAYAVSFGIRDVTKNMGNITVRKGENYYFEMNAKFGYVQFRQISSPTPSKKLKSKNFISKTDINYIGNNIVYNHPSTKWTKEKLKKHWKENGHSNLEGIYEKVRKYLKYELAIIKENNEYKIVYLSGVKGSSWKEGDLKAIMQKTANSRIFKSNWYMLDKTNNDEMMITFEGTTMKVFDRESDLYLKIYPTYDDSDDLVSSNWKSSGTGFFIDKNGYFVTNYHVIEGGKEFEVDITSNGKTISYQAEIINSDKLNDLSIMKIKGNFKPLLNLAYNFNTKTQDVGSSVFALGYPLTQIMGSEIKFTDGKISSKSGYKGDITKYQITVPIQHGNSGGPLFDEKGNLVGITSSGLSKQIADNVNYAIKTSYLNLLIDATNDKIELPKSNELESFPLTEQIKRLSEYVVLIKVK